MEYRAEGRKLEERRRREMMWGRGEKPEERGRREMTRSAGEPV